MPLVADHNVTFKYIDPTKWNKTRSTFAWRENPDFTKGVSEQLNNKGLTNSDTIIVICGSGRRAAKAATALKKAGFGRVYSVTDGYPGWQKANLGWSRKLDMNKVLVK